MFPGLTARPIHRLNSTNALLQKRLKTELESLALLISERRNYAQLRSALQKRAAPLILPLDLLQSDHEHRVTYMNEMVGMPGECL